MTASSSETACAALPARNAARGSLARPAPRRLLDPFRC